MPSVRPWAGSRLDTADAHVGELWLAGPDSVVAIDGGERTLDALAAAHGEDLVGRRGMALLGARFPLIAKLIDAADWLSLQVHPDDALARELYGPGAVGKTEAWLVLDADPGAELVTGPADDVDEATLRAAVAAGDAAMRHCRRSPARAGDTLLLQAGTLHAIGAGTFVYEIEQPSDLTFRVSDWGRSGRTLHLAESLRALRATGHAVPCGTGFYLDGGALEVPEFRLELPTTNGPRLERAPAGRSCEVVTSLRGTLRLEADDWAEALEPYETLVVPAIVGRYAITGPAEGLAAVGSIP
jgi:mannose-6-phosphate isomerase